MTTNSDIPFVPEEESPEQQLLPIFEGWSEAEPEDLTDAELAQAICRKMMTEGFGLFERIKTRGSMKAYIETGFFPMTAKEADYLERMKEL